MSADEDRDVLLDPRQLSWIGGWFHDQDTETERNGLKLLGHIAALDELRYRVERLTYASDDGSEWEHNGHPPNEGEAECPGCWAADIRRALRGDS